MEERPNWVLRAIYHGLRISLALAFLIFLLRSDWSSAFYTFLIFILLILPSVIKERYNVHVPFELDLAIGGFTYLALFLGSLNGFYERFPLWDVVLHFQSGILLGLVGFVMVYILNGQKTGKLKLSPGFLSFFAFCFSLALGAVWEIFEFAMDHWFTFNMQETGLPDTMGDLMVNGIGAFIVVTIGYIWMRRNLRIPFTPRLLARFEAPSGMTKPPDRDIANPI